MLFAFILVQLENPLANSLARELARAQTRELARALARELARALAREQDSEIEPNESFATPVPPYHAVL